MLNVPCRNACDGRLARSFLAVAQDLAEKGPDHDDRRVNLPATEHVAMSLEDSRNPFGRENRGKRQPRLCKEAVRNALETGSAVSRGTW
jgi:hypothetical protein